MKKALDAFPEALVGEDQEGYLTVTTGWKQDPDDPDSLYIPDERERHCDLCGWAEGDGHNWEAHNAEMRADEYRQYEHTMGYQEDPFYPEGDRW